MSAMIVNSQQEIDKAYYYDNKAKSPKSVIFPCILICDYDEGGIGGSSYSYSILAPPRGTSAEYTRGWLDAAIFTLNNITEYEPKILATAEWPKYFIHTDGDTTFYVLASSNTKLDTYFHNGSFNRNDWGDYTLDHFITQGFWKEVSKEEAEARLK